MTNTQLTRPLSQPHIEDESYQRIHQSLETSPKALAFFTCLSHFSSPIGECQYGKSSNEQDHKCPTDHFQHQHFCRAFSTLQVEEKQHFLRRTVQILDHFKNKQLQNSFSQKFHLQFSCLAMAKSCVVKKWKEARVVVDFQMKKVILSSDSGQQVINMKHYIPRRSKVHQLCLAFQNIWPVKIEEVDDIRIKFDKNSYEQFMKFEKHILSLAADAVAEGLARLVRQAKLIDQRIRQKKNVRLMASQQNIHLVQQAQALAQHNHYTVHSQSDRSQLCTDQLSMVASCSEVEAFKIIKSSPILSISVSESNQFVYRSRLIVQEHSKGKSLDKFLTKYKSGHQMVFKLKLLEELRGKTKQGTFAQTYAFYQMIVWNQKVFGQMLIAHQQSTVEHPTPNNIFYSFRNIDSPENISLIDTMKINCREISNSQLQIDIEVKFNNQREFSQEAYLYYLQCFKDVFSGASIVSELHSDTKLIRNDVLSLFLPSVSNPNPVDNISGDLSNQNEQPFHSISHGEAPNHQFLLEQSHVQNDSLEYMKRHHQTKPSKHKIGTLMKQHFLWKNWKRAEDGGLICRDQQLVARQKKLAKIVLAKFGETILKGKNIINFSLPVVVFKKESHLESIARTYLYSPVFMQKAALLADPLERMKQAIVIMMTQNALSIHMEKPFNPILGETFQGSIDGCPIYLEQISHHPPVSAYYFLGRGYKKYGSIEPRISIGLNKGSGYSLNPHYIQFDDGMKIEYICAKIVIGGMLVGDRTFKFEDKIYAYDRKHRFFASLKFGPLEEGFFSSSPQPQDYFHGFIYEVTPEFEIYFSQNMPRPHPQEKHILKKLAEFDGIWNSYVNINKEEVVNFKTDLPYQFQVERAPLPSDSRYRRDLIQLLKGDVQAAQEQKEKMEEEQRYDRKLREQFEQKLKSAR